MQKRKVAILLFDDVEVLDFAGPFEVFSITNELNDYTLMDIYTVAARQKTITAKNGLSLNTDYSLADAPWPDMLIVPGGAGARQMMGLAKLTAWVARCSEVAEIVMSVCTGAFILAGAGLLEGLQVTTHYQVLDILRSLEPQAEVVGNKRFTDNGNMLTAAGVSAGIDMSLYVVGRIYGREIAHQTAEYIEYDYKV